MLKSRLRRIAAAAAAALIVSTGLVGLSATSASATTVAPHGSIYMMYNATISETGTGTGYSSYINVHDAHNNALSVGIQSDTASSVSRGAPRYIWERVQNGKFTYGYLGPATHKATAVSMRWYPNNVATYLVNGHTIAAISMKLQGRFFFNVEGNARLNGDVVHSSMSNVQITVGAHPGQIGLTGEWNTKSFSFHGLKATQTNSAKNQGASFWVNGRVSGLPRGGNWDTEEVAGIGMIAEHY